MNNGSIIAWMDDLQMSAHLAKISTAHSYTLQFCDTISEISDISHTTVLIIDLSSTSEDELRRIIESKKNHNIILMGFCREVNSSLIKYFKEMGCDMVFKRYELMKNLGSILKTIFHAS